MQVTIWGARGGIAAGGVDTLRHGGDTPCVSVLGPDGQWIILDAGTGIRRLGEHLMRLPTPPSGRTEISLLLSHFHWDHVQGLPFFAPVWSDRFALHVYASAEAATTERCVRHQFESPFFPVGLRHARAELRFDRLSGTATVAGMHVTPFPQHHPGGSTGFRVEAGGKALVYATDTEGGEPALEAELQRHARGAGLLVLDAQYTPAEAARRVGWGHGDWQRAAAVAQAANVGQLLLFHHDPARTDAGLDGITAEARQFFARTDTARQDAVFHLSDSSAVAN